MGPYYCLDILTAFYTSLRLETSHFIEMHFPPPYLISWPKNCKGSEKILSFSIQVALHFSILMSKRLILAPILLSLSAINLPIPIPPPVRKTCFPLRDFLSSQPFYLRNVLNPQRNKMKKKSFFFQRY